jgi:hypothetical protein
MRTPYEEVEKIEKRNKSLGHFLRLYLEQKSNLETMSRRELVNFIMSRLDVSQATAYDYANALKILIQEEGSEEENPLKDSWQPLRKTGARNRTEAIKIIAGMVEPPLIMKMKEYGLNLWKDLFLGGGPIPCDRNMFANELGILIGKVGNVAVLDSDFAHAPKALAEACFVKAMEIVNPLVEIRGLNPHEDALRYVEWILRYRAKRQEKTKRKESLVQSDECVVGSRPERIEAVYNRKKPFKSRYLRGLDMWFILPGEPIADALIKYCYEKEVYWQEAVRNLLSKQLSEEGYL